MLLFLKTEKKKQECDQTAREMPSQSSNKLQTVGNEFSKNEVLFPLQSHHFQVTARIDQMN